MAKKKKKRVKIKSVDQVPGPALASFESALNELETTVRELEAGNLSLSDSLLKYESGIRNLKTCHQILEQAECRIRLLTGVDKNGSIATVEFDAQKSELYQPGMNSATGFESDDESLDEEDGFDADEDDDIEDHDIEDDDIEDVGDEDQVDDSGTLF